MRAGLGWPRAARVLAAACSGLCVLALAAAPAVSQGGRGLQVGSAMADFGLRRLDLRSGKLAEMIWLSDFVGGDSGDARKRLLLLNFFASWCKPCVRELPLLAGLQAKYGERGLQVVSVYHRGGGESVEQAIAQTRKHVDDQLLPYPLLFDRYTSRNQLLYMGAEAVLPCNVVIDARGKIVARFQGARAVEEGALEAEVERLLEVEP